MTKKVASDLTFVPSPAFPSCVGFFVRATVESLESIPENRKYGVAHAWEEDGYEVVFHAKRDHLVPYVGLAIDIPGHAILGYSGALGAWTGARVRHNEEVS